MPEKHRHHKHSSSDEALKSPSKVFHHHHKQNKRPILLDNHDDGDNDLIVHTIYLHGSKDESNNDAKQGYSVSGSNTLSNNKHHMDEGALISHRINLKDDLNRVEQLLNEYYKKIKGDISNAKSLTKFNHQNRLHSNKQVEAKERHNHHSPSYNKERSQPINVDHIILNKKSNSKVKIDSNPKTPVSLRGKEEYDDNDLIVHTIYLQGPEGESVSKGTEGRSPILKNKKHRVHKSALISHKRHLKNDLENLEKDIGEKYFLHIESEPVIPR